MENHFFSFKGRIGIATYFFRALIGFGIMVVSLLIATKLIIPPIIEAERSAPWDVSANFYSNDGYSDSNPYDIADTIIRIIFICFMMPQVVKRMHDVNKSGWYGLIPFYSWILVFTPGTKGPNIFGEDPQK